ncbi:hypothetical protein B6S12_08410 [Helicobacter valdiviensis]|uniref:Uncharacterized protein n=1 Tax=Helicobacter valdiviensis TaxID=1458358 RepID=A0A2W6MWH6_9HELI|nr:hypothetical protein B6S12_08410 [Helicobacter valdiviensis]
MYGGIASIVLGSLLGYFLYAREPKLIKPFIISIFNIVPCFLVWCCIYFLAYRARKKQEDNKAYKTRHFYIIVCLFNGILFLYGFYSNFFGGILFY